MDNVQYAGSHPESFGTTDMPSTSAPISDKEPVFYASAARMQATPLFHALNGSPLTRPKWIVPKLQRQTDNHRQYDKAALGFCHRYYHHGHIEPKHELTFREVPKVSVNYETLTPAYRTRVQSTLYEDVKALLTNAALARTEIPVVEPIPDQAENATVPTNGI